MIIATHYLTQYRTRTLALPEFAGSHCFKKSKYCHISPLFWKLHWLPIKYCIIFKQCLVIFKSTPFDIPTNLKYIIIPYTCLTYTCRYKLEKIVLQFPAFMQSIHKSTSHFDAAFSVFGPNIWILLRASSLSSPHSCIFFGWFPPGL